MNKKLFAVGWFIFVEQKRRDEKGSFKKCSVDNIDMLTPGLVDTSTFHWSTSMAALFQWEPLTNAILKIAAYWLQHFEII